MFSQRSNSVISRSQSGAARSEVVLSTVNNLTKTSAGTISDKWGSRDKAPKRVPFVRATIIAHFINTVLMPA